MKQQLRTMAVSAAALLGAVTGEHALAIDYKTIDVPFAYNGYGGGTFATGVSGSTIVGYYTSGPFTYHGFVYDGTTYTTFDAPQAVNGTYTYGISGNRIVGTFLDANNVEHGYLYDGSAWTVLNDPEAGPFFGTQPVGVSGNNVVGGFRDKSGTSHGFLFNGMNWTTIDYPGASSTVASGIEGNRITGSYDSNSVRHSFIYESGTFTNVPDAPGTNYYSNVTGISGSNLVGFFNDTSPGSSNHGFLFDGSTWTIVDDPNANSDGGTRTTVAMGVDGNTVVGWYDVAPSMYHGFVTVVPEPPSLVIAILGTLICSLSSRSTGRDRRK